jgi:hypothetical protein
LRLLFARVFLAGAQEVLANEAVVKMVKSKLGRDLIISMVQVPAGQGLLEHGRAVDVQGSPLVEEDPGSYDEQQVWM